jgi:hypothetical protein
MSVVPPPPSPPLPRFPHICSRDRTFPLYSYGEQEKEKERTLTLCILVLSALQIELLDIVEIEEDGQREPRLKVGSGAVGKITTIRLWSKSGVYGGCKALHGACCLFLSPLTFTGAALGACSDCA